MYKYNKFNIGDIVGHNEAPHLKFRITAVLPGEPEEEENYAYGYSQIVDEDYNVDMEAIFDAPDGGVYLEPDLFYIRKPSYDELSKMLDESILQEKRFNELSTEIRNQRNKLINRN